MCLPDQHLPLRALDFDLRLPLHTELRRPSGASVDERARVAWVMEDLQDSRVIETSPQNVTLADPAPDPAREQDPLALEAAHRCRRRTALAVGLEQQPY